MELNLWYVKRIYKHAHLDTAIQDRKHTYHQFELAWPQKSFCYPPKNEKGTNHVIRYTVYLSTIYYYYKWNTPFGVKASFEVGFTF